MMYVSKLWSVPRPKSSKSMVFPIVTEIADWNIYTPQFTAIIPQFKSEIRLLAEKKRTS